MHIPIKNACHLCMLPLTPLHPTLYFGTLLYHLGNSNSLPAPLLSSLAASLLPLNLAYHTYPPRDKVQG